MRCKFCGPCWTRCFVFYLAGHALLILLWPTSLESAADRWALKTHGNFTQPTHNFTINRFTVHSDWSRGLHVGVVIPLTDFRFIAVKCYTSTNHGYVETLRIFMLQQSNLCCDNSVLIRFRFMHKAYLVRVRKRSCLVLKYLFWSPQTQREMVWKILCCHPPQMLEHSLKLWPLT